MSHVLFVTWDGGGNVPPALRIAGELRERGHEVRVLGHPAQENAVGVVGRFEPYRHARAFSPLERVTTPRWMMTYLRLFTDPALGTDLDLALDREPADLVVVDAMLLGPLRAARRRGVRTVALMHTLHDYMTRKWAGGPIGLVGRLRGLPPQRLWDAADRVLVPGLAGLEPGRQRPGNVRLTGPVWPQGAVAPVSHAAGEPRVLVSLSSIYYNGQVRAIQSIVDALAEVPVQALLTTGNSVRPEEISAPANVEVLGFVPHPEIMPKVSLVVGHGGFSTAMQALAHDLPMVVMPMTGLGDQPAVAAALRRTGVAAVVRRTSAVASIRAAVLRMLADGPHRAAAARLGAQARAADGAVNAADEIELLL